MWWENCSKYGNDVWYFNWSMILQIYTKYILVVFHVCVVHWEQWQAGGELGAFLHSKTSTCTTADRFRTFNPVCLPGCQHHHGHTCLTFSSLPLSFLCKMASAWLCHHHKVASHPAWACMFSHVWRALVWIPMWGHVSLAARLILASFCCVVSWREAELSWWPPRWADGNEESSVKVRGVESFYDSKEGVCVCVCVCVVAVMGVFTPPTLLKLGTVHEESWQQLREADRGPWDGSRKVKYQILIFQYYFTLYKWVLCNLSAGI